MGKLSLVEGQGVEVRRDVCVGEGQKDGAAIEEETQIWSLGQRQRAGRRVILGTAVPECHRD